ncbi:oxidoreductase family protein, partial [gut metagenome]
MDGFVYAVSADISREKVLEKLEHGPYGRCVFRCDNDVVDHQVVQMEFDNQVTASMTMCAFTAVCERTITLMGTRGQIVGNMEKSTLTLSDFLTGTETEIRLHAPEKGHSGSDTKMMHGFVELMNQDSLDSGRSGAEV